MCFIFFLLLNKNLIRKLLNKNLEKIKLEKMYVKINTILIYFQSIGFLEHMSNGCIP